MDLKRLMFGEFNLKRFLVSIVMIYGIISLFVFFYAEKLIFPYDLSSYDKSLSGLKIIKSTDNTDLATRYWPVNNDDYLVLYFHGNYLDIGNLDEVAKLLNGQGYSMLAMDYRGYGLSKGQATESNVYTDAQVVYNMAIKMGYVADKIIILGRSIGTGVATELAVKNPSKALILISPFVSNI